MEKINPAQQQFFIVLLTLIILVPALYWNSLDVPFHYDDQQNIEINTNIHLTKLSFDQLKQSWTSTNRPVAMVSFALNYYFGGFNVTGYHVVNILIHMTAGIFLYLFIFNTLKLPTIREKYFTHAPYIALIATLLWVTSPVQTQAVTYIVQRMASMSAMFFIMAMYFYLKARMNPDIPDIIDNKTKHKADTKTIPRPRTPRSRSVFFSLSIVSGLLAIGTKENAFMLPFVIFIYDFFLIQGLNKKNTRQFIKYTCLLAPICIFIAVKACLVYEHYYDQFFFTLKERVLTEPRIIFFYISLLLFPDSNRLVLFHDIPLSHSLTDPLTSLFSILGIIVVVSSCLILAKKHPLISFCTLFFFINHAVESSFIPLILIFEHRVYLPSMLFFIPFTILFFKAVDALSSKRLAVWLLAGLMGIVLLSQCYDTVHRNMAWKSSYALWMDVINKSPKLSEGYSNMGVLLKDRGMYKKAAIALEKGMALDSFTKKKSREAAILNLISTYYTLEEYQKALAVCQKSGYLAPSDPLISYYMGLIYEKLGNHDMAVKYLKRASTVKNYFVMAMNALGELYLESKEPEKAFAAFKKIQDFIPGDMQSKMNMGIALRIMGEPQRAVTLLKPVLNDFNKNDPWAIKTVFVLFECQHLVGDYEGIKQARLKFLASLEPGMINTLLTFLIQNQGGIAEHLNADLVLKILKEK